MAVSQICPGLYLSSLDSALNRSVLSSRNVTLVVNASGLEGVSYPQLDGLQVLTVPVQDQPHAPLGHYFDLVSERINQNQTGSTLVHCMAGRSRSPALIMAYLIRFEGVTLRRAHELVLEQRPFIRPNAGFWRQLMEYERSRTGRSTLRMARTSGGVLPEALDNLEDSEDLDPSAAYCVNV
ncbi:dual specificity protein phosphatase 14 [Cheilinus undulatus]|uniref:dual specificity protein phosphatase 14 n=1 Tax=Cheilinus undulatus TaxID=241271 RepID=UPI001BD277B8|nr:dual specificity protein phosphatase 14 [Cheilinus undulatus]XP_041655521.1 dual specificity protein phosphatase 14 [Cheilinus undulatus]XP_041655530.1 dual specificity protein phosphatase 14 [Cheilinus undulatus]